MCHLRLVAYDTVVYKKTMCTLIFEFENFFEFQNVMNDSPPPMSHSDVLRTKVDMLSIPY